MSEKKETFFFFFFTRIFAECLSEKEESEGGGTTNPGTGMGWHRFGFQTTDCYCSRGLGTDNKTIPRGTKACSFIILYTRQQASAGSQNCHQSTEISDTVIAEDI